MLLQTKGIVLHNVKYGESSLISTIYTERFGRQAYLINGARGKKAKNKASLLQPLFLLDMVVYQKETREIQRIKEFKPGEAFCSIPFNVIKTTQAIFIAEILFRVLREEETNRELFEFCENAIKFLDLSNQGTSNFHLLFLSKLTRHLGIYPNIDAGANNTWFDLKKGKTVAIEPAHPFFMNKYETQIFSELIYLNMENLPDYKLKRETRDSLLTKIVEYYRQHFDTMGEIKSLHVLKEVFEP